MDGSADPVVQAARGGLPAETKMTKPFDEKNARQWLRYLGGELPADEARDLERRLAADGELGARYRRFAETWNGLEEPPREPLPADFSARVVAAARDLRAGRGAVDLSSTLAPAWARAGAIAALLAGLALGAAIGGTTVAGPELESEDTSVYAFSEPLSLAESFWLAVDEGDEGLGEGDGGGEVVR